MPHGLVQAAAGDELLEELLAALHGGADVQAHGLGQFPLGHFQLAATDPGDELLHTLALGGLQLALAAAASGLQTHQRNAACLLLCHFLAHKQLGDARCAWRAVAAHSGKAREQGFALCVHGRQLGVSLGQLGSEGGHLGLQAGHRGLRHVGEGEPEP